MQHRPLESLKDTAVKLANTITNNTPPDDRSRELEQRLIRDGFQSTDETPVNSGTAKSDIDSNPERVGIWVPEMQEGKKAFVRDLECKDEFNSWARVKNIPPKGIKKRVVYLGESVSRGYLLDPFYTPAGVLETLLNAKPPLLRAEVIDLARTNCKMPLLTELTETCMAMKPDAVVIFAGNNWINGLDLTDSLASELDAAFDSEDRFARVRTILESKYKELVANFMKRVSQVSTANQVPVVYVIPEFNLLDYCSNPAQRINLWPMGETGRWLSLKEECEQAIKDGDIDKAESLGHELIRLNEGNPYGYELLGQCKLKRELFDEAVQWLRKALDTSMFRFQNAPACISIVRETLKEEAEKYKIPVVDLPEVFKQSQNGRPPGRELFIDYCHLSDHGIRVAMTHTASKVFGVLARFELPVKTLEPKAPKPDKDTLARAHFFAAIHNAHRGEQPYEILYYHCNQALNHSDKVKNLMINYIDMASRHTVWSLSKECENLFESGEMDQFPNVLQPDNHYIMDIRLVDALVAALKEHGTDIADRVNQFRKREHGFVTPKINLLESYYHLESYVAAYRPEGSYYRTPAPHSRFLTVLGNDRPVRLKLTYRVPEHNYGDENVRIELNGSVLKQLPAVRKWEEVSIEVDKGLLADGVNTLTIHWPSVIDFRKSLRDPRFPITRATIFHQKMYPTYGEIYRFVLETE